MEDQTNYLELFCHYIEKVYICIRQSLMYIIIYPKSNTMNYLVLITAMLPVVVLMYIIYKKDSLQPEPKGQLRKAFYLGVLSCFLSFLISGPLNLLGVFHDNVSTLLDAIRLSFFGAAIPEEIAKFAVLWFFLRKNPYFDEKVDGIVYAACVSMGFAALENILYLYSNIDNFMMVGVVRAIFAVPGHLCFGIMMGYYYSLVKFYPNSKRHTTNCIMVLLVPILLHGLYDTMLFSFKTLHPVAVLVVFVTFLFFCFKMWKYAARRIEEHLARDMNTGTEEERQKCVDEFRRLAKENPKMYEPELAEVLACMGDFYQTAERYEEAEAVYEESLDIYRRADLNSEHSYKAEMAKVLYSLGVVYFFGFGKYDDSNKALKEAVQIYYGMGSNAVVDTRLASVFERLGQINYNAEHYDDARDNFGHALELYRKHSDKERMAYAMFGIGNAYCGMKRYGESRRWYDDVIEVYKELEVKHPDYSDNRLHAMMLKADSFQMEGCCLECEEVYNEVCVFLRELESKYPGAYTEELAIVKKNLGELYYEMEESERCRKALAEAISLFDSIQEKSERIIELQTMASELLEEVNKDADSQLPEQEEG